jgi:transposase-like protein
MLRWPLTNVLEEQACYAELLPLLQPHGLQCPQGHTLPPDPAPHARHRVVVGYHCRQCGAVFNPFTGTLFSKSRYSCAIILQILREIAQGVPTAHLAAELHIDRGHFLRCHPAIHALLEQPLPPRRCPTRCRKVMQCYITAGEKGWKQADPARLPWRRTNKRQDHGTWTNARRSVVLEQVCHRVRMGT